MKADLGAAVSALVQIAGDNRREGVFAPQATLASINLGAEKA
jgi:hypothetical protein